MQDESLLSILQFIDNPPTDPTEKAEQGARFVSMLNTRIKSIESANGITLFSYGGIIHQLKADGSWRKFPGMTDASKFKDFASQHLGMSITKANILERLWREGKEKGLIPEYIEEVGWDIAQLILRVAKDNQDVIAWMDVYHRSSRKEFKYAVALARRQRIAPKPSSEKHTQAITMLDTVTEALAIVAQQSGKELDVTMSRQEAMTELVKQWKSSHAQ